jgi:hypothetical protein
MIVLSILDGDFAAGFGIAVALHGAGQMNAARMDEEPR